MTALARVLFVDDEPNVLEGIKRGLRGRVELHVATSGEQGLAALRDPGQFALLVSDMRMPGMSGAQFLAKARAANPDAVRMILSGQSDLESAIAAVNDGHIFRFISKPCSTDQLWAAIEAGLEQHRLLTAEKVLLEQTLAGAIKMLVEILGLVSPTAYGRAARLQRYVEAIVAGIGVPDRWQLPLAALVSQLGCVTLPKDTLTKLDAGQELSEEEQRLFDSHPEVASRLLATIPRLEDVAAIIAGQRQAPQPGSRPADLGQWDTQTLGHTVLWIACEFDRQVTRGVKPSTAVQALREPRLGLASAFIDALSTLSVPASQSVRRMLRLKDLMPGMILDEGIVTTKGMLLVPTGQEVTASLLSRLHTVTNGVGVIEPFRVQVPIWQAATGDRATKPPPA